MDNTHSKSRKCINNTVCLLGFSLGDTPIRQLTATGPIIRISPDELHIHDAEFFDKLYNNEGKWNKYAWAYDAFGVQTATVATVDHDWHKRRRAAISSYFSKPNVARKQDILRRGAAKLTYRLSEYDGLDETVNLSHAMSALARDVAGEFLLGRISDNLDAPDFKAEMTQMSQGFGSVWRYSKHTPFLARTLKLLHPSLMASIVPKGGAKEFFSFVVVSDTCTKFGGTPDLHEIGHSEYSHRCSQRRTRWAFRIR